MTGPDRLLDPEFDRSALIVIDMQNDFADSGTSPVAGTSGVAPVIAGLAAAYRKANRPIIHVVRLYEGDDVDLVRREAIASGAQIARPGTAGSQIIAGLLPPGAPRLDPELLLTGAPQRIRAGEVVLWKPRWSAFHRTGLDAHLAGLGVSTLVFAGCNFPNCPRAAIFDASERDYKVVVVSDAISGIAHHHLDETRRIGAVPLPAKVVLDALADT